MLSPTRILLTTIAALLASLSEAPSQKAAGQGANDPAARAILDAAAKVQTPNGPRPITSYHATYVVTVFEDEQGKPSSGRTGKIEQKWLQKKAGKTMYRRVFRNTVTNDPPAHYISNGSTFMYQVEGRRARAMRTDPNLKRDLDNLKEEIRRTGELMKLFFLGNLVGDETTVSMGNLEATIPNPKGRGRPRLAVDEVIVKRPSKIDVLLRVGKGDHFVYEAELVPREPGGATERFQFSHHQPIEDQRIGKVVVPMRITYMTGDRLVMRAAVDNPQTDVRFNVKLKRNPDFTTVK